MWLSNTLKNSNYKSVIHNYLTTNNYPFEDGIKVGFNCGFSGQNMNHKKRESEAVNTDKIPVGKNPKDNRRDLIVNLDEVKLINEFIKKNNITFDFD